MSRALSEIKQTLVLGIPMAGAQLSQMAMSATDVAYIGKLGSGDALAAMAVGQAAYGAFLAFGIGLIAAVNPLVSQAYGAGREGEARRPMGVGICFALAYGVLAWALLWNIDMFYAVMRYSPDVARQATLYVRCIMLGLPAYFVFLSAKNYLDSTSRPRLPFAVAFTAIGVNAMVAYTLVFGHFGVPKFGVVGVALTTATVNVVMALALLGLAWKDLSKGFIKPRADEVREFLTMGLPIAGSLLVEVGLFVASALIMGKLGSELAAANQIVITCASTTFMLSLGLSFAGATRVGQAVGAGQFQRVRSAGLAAIGVGVCAMVVSGSIFISFPGFLVDLFWDGEGGGHQVRIYAINLLGVAGIFQIFDGMQVTSSGALRGMKDVRIPLLIAFVSYWLVGLGTASYLAFFTSLAYLGVWVGQLTGLACAAVLLFSRFLVLSKRLDRDPELRQRVQVDSLVEQEG